MCQMKPCRRELLVRSSSVRICKPLQREFAEPSSFFFEILSMDIGAFEIASLSKKQRQSHQTFSDEILIYVDRLLRMRPYTPLRGEYEKPNEDWRKFLKKCTRKRHAKNQLAKLQLHPQLRALRLPHRRLQMHL